MYQFYLNGKTVRRHIRNYDNDLLPAVLCRPGAGEPARRSSCRTMDAVKLYAESLEAQDALVDFMQRPAKR